ncbi:MAG: 16S rRNA (cytosine(1402)-N(4))-methyltransferase RsmH [Angelakisella sp.]|jgi:16S rRNA (cytosine1402-N4)-methyltransferase|nr:16S rRNA (cytosine(1402)-N(4))-methyltransferase RsmH [Angelakisella sp.]
MEFCHTSVLFSQCMEGLAIQPEGIYLDGTAGGGGHSLGIARRLTTGRLIALDKDPDAVKAAGERLAGLPARVVESDYADIPQVLDSLGIDKVDGILLDLGVSSYQLDTPERGFSYMADAPLDMRMTQQGFSARDLVNQWDVSSIARALREFGEEKYALAIAKRIARAREQQPVETTGQLVEIIKSAIPPSARYEGGHPAKRTFQAIRIAVNSELDNLSRCLDTAFGRLAPGGRFAIITFHSLEDRMVKQKFAAYCKGCVCPPDFPVCVCGHTPEGRLVNKKPIEPDEEERQQNSRSHSAKLRILEKL